MIHGAADESVAVSAAETIFAALPEATRELLILAGTGHTFGGVHPLAAIPEPLGRVFEATIGHLAARLP